MSDEQGMRVRDLTSVGLREAVPGSTGAPLYATWRRGEVIPPGVGRGTLAVEAGPPPTPAGATVAATALAGAGVPALAVGPDAEAAWSPACAAAGVALWVGREPGWWEEVEDAVARRTLDAQAYRLRRLVAYQNDLLAALGDDRPVQALMARLAQRVRGTAALYDSVGRIAAAVGEGPVRLIRGELHGRERVPVDLRVGRYAVAARPVVMRGTGYWLALATRHEDHLAEVGVPLLEVAQRMLSAMRGARALGRTGEQERERHILTLLRADVAPERVPRLWERLRAFRFQPHQPVRALVAAPVDAASEHPRRRADRLELLHESAYTWGLPLVLADDAGTPEQEQGALLVALAADEAALTSWAAHLAQTHLVGLGEPFTELVRSPGGFRDAGMALDIARRRVASSGGPGPGLVVRFEEADLATWLLSGRPVEAVRARARARFGALVDRDELVETLTAYLAVDLDVGACAKRLFIHPNTVRYRLRKAEEAIGAPLAAPATITNLYLALHERLT